MNEITLTHVSFDDIQNDTTQDDVTLDTAKQA
jgi:hypothetical protein